MRDFAQVKGDGTITLKITKYALEALNVDLFGLDEMDNRILSAIIDKFKGGPVFYPNAYKQVLLPRARAECV